jgi:hypothetical protein
LARAKSRLLSLLLIVCIVAVVLPSVLQFGFVSVVKADPSVAFSAVELTSVHTCPLDQRTFVVAYHDETNDDFSFQVYDTNGTQVRAETDVDDTSGGTMAYTSIGVSAFNSTTFVVGWFDKTDSDATFAVYNTTGNLLSGPTDADTDVGAAGSVQVSCFDSTHFVIAWFDTTDLDATFAIYDSSSALIAGPTDASDDVWGSYSVSVSTFDATQFVIAWFDKTDSDATFRIYNSAGLALTGEVDADTDVGATCYSVSVSTLNSTHFVIGWFDKTDSDAIFAVYNSTGTLTTGPTSADADIGTTSKSVQVSALNSTAFVISWYDYVDFDLSFATYLSNGTAVAALTDIESWPAAANAPFMYQSPCSQETANSIKIYGDNWIIAYGNTTTQAIWKTFYPNGTEWDGTVPVAVGWSYRRSHVVNNATGAGTNYQVQIIVVNGSVADSGNVVYINSKTRADFGDVRFTDDDGVTLLDCWMETLNTGINATFWVEVADDLSSANRTIYVYYGKADATYPYLASDTKQGEATFLFFDHFPCSAIDTFKWGNGTADATVASSIMRHINASSGYSWLRTLASFGPAVRYRAYGQTYQVGGISYNHLFGFLHVDSVNIASIMYWSFDVNWTKYASKTGGATVANMTQVADLNWHIFQVFYVSSASCKYEIDSNAVEEITTNVSSIALPVCSVVYSAPGTAIDKYDWTFVSKYVSPEPIHAAWGAEEVLLNSSPTIGAAAGTNWDDIDNCYAQKKTYTVSVTYTDTDGFADVHYCELYLKTGGNATRAEFQFHEDDNSWSTPAGSTEWTLTGYSNASAGNNIAVVWGFQAQWDATEESDLDFLFFVTDTAAASTNSVSDENFDVVTRLVTSGFMSDDPRINLAGTTTLNGTVYYGNDPASNVASTSYPPDAEFTQVDLHDSVGNVVGTDNVIVNGYFSASFAIPNAVQSNTYHVYINLADVDGTDQDAVDGDTTAVIGDRFKVNAATLAFEDPDGRVNVGTAGIFSCTVQSEHDGHVLGAGDSLVLSSYVFTYNGTYWVNSTTQAAPTSVTINSLTSLSEATFGITSGTINANSANGKWDRIRIDSLACADIRIDVSTEGLFYCTASLETDGHTLGAADSLTLTGHVFAWNVTTVRFEYKETNASVTDTTIDSFTSGNEVTYGITAGNINSMTATETWDRYKVNAASLTFSDLDGRANVGVIESFSCTAQSEYDGHVLGGVGDTLSLSGYTFFYNGTYWVNSTFLAAPADITINALTSVYEATFGIGAGNINGNSAVGIWDNLTVINIQPVQYLGSGNYKYEAQLKYGYDLALISGGYVDLEYPNGTLVGKTSSNATGWVTFNVGQLNSTSGTFTLYGENETSYSITVSGANQTFANYYWTFAPQDVDGNSLTNTNHSVTLGATAVWNGIATAVYVPADTFNVTVTWLQNLAVNSTFNTVIAGDTTTNLNCTCYPYVIGATRYWAASNATITSSAYVGFLLTVKFSCVNNSYVLVASYTTRPSYVLNVTYDYTTAFAPGYLVLPHFGNMTIVAGYENWAGLYVKKTDRLMLSVGWAGQQLDIVTNGTVGDSGELDVYCSSRGAPGSDSGFTVTSYIGGVFIGLYTFASPHTGSLEWTPASSGGSTGGPIQAPSLFITLAFTFPKNVQSGATLDGFLNVSWMGAAKVYIWSAVVSSEYAKDWKIQVSRLPWTLETLMQNGRAQVPVVLYITGGLAAGNYSVPCDVTFNTVEGVSKTIRSILTFEVTTPIAEVPSTLVYVFLGGLAIVVTSGLFLGTQKRRKYNQ